MSFELNNETIGKLNEGEVLSKYIFTFLKNGIDL